MSLEIERKFLTASDAWKARAVRSIHIRDGLVANRDGQKVRVRIADNVATITLKSERKSTTRSEFEYEIPLSDAEEMLDKLCGEHRLQKVRHFVPHNGLTWFVDVYEGLLAGVVLAEVELQQADQTIELPDWIGTEVTRDPRYRKTSLFAERTGALRRRQATTVASKPPGSGVVPPVLSAPGI